MMVSFQAPYVMIGLLAGITIIQIIDARQLHHKLSRMESELSSSIRSLFRANLKDTGDDTGRSRRAVYEAKLLYVPATHPSFTFKAKA